MAKAQSVIKLIQILLGSNDFVMADDLAEILDTNKRNIREYILEAEELGYVIESKRGFYGGYKLVKSQIIPQPKLTYDELESIRNTLAYLKDSDYNNPLFFDAMGKVLTTIEYKDFITPPTVIDRYPLVMDKEKLQDRFQTLSNAIENQLKCEIVYLSSQNTLKKHIIHPYKLFNYNNNWLVLAYNEVVNKIGYYKLNRMESLYESRNHFTKMNFDESEYIDEFGMKNNGDFYEIELELTNLNTLIKERIYGKNQEVIEIDSNHVRLICEMQNKNSIKAFVMSFGSKCKVISPDWLKEDIEKEYYTALEQYE